MHGLILTLPGGVAVGRTGPAAVGGGLPAPGPALALALVAALAAAVVGVAPVLVVIVIVKVAGNLKLKSQQDDLSFIRHIMDRLSGAS